MEQQQQQQQQQVFPRIVVIRQNSAVEDVIVNGQVSKVIHIVVKNSPFIVVIGGAGTVPINLGDYDVDCILLYDTENDTHKAVDYVKSKPVEFKSTVLDRGQQVQLEMRIKVLTSQHEDMNFRVLIQLVDRATKTPIRGAATITNPIKVVSKPEQLKKHKANLTGPTIKAVPPASLTSQVQSYTPKKQKASQQQQQQQQQQNRPMDPIVETQYQYTQSMPLPSILQQQQQQQQQQKQNPVTNDIRMGISSCPIPAKMPKTNDSMFGLDVINQAIMSTVQGPSAPISMAQQPSPPQTSSSSSSSSMPMSMAMSSSSSGLAYLQDTKLGIGMFNTGNSSNASGDDIGYGRKITDIIVETLKRIEQKQQSNTEMLSNINENVSKQIGLYYSWGDYGYQDPSTQMGNSSSMMMSPGSNMQPPPPSQSPSSSSSVTSSMSYGDVSMQQQEQQQQQQQSMPPQQFMGMSNDFDVAFTNLMDAYGRMPPVERAARVRRILQIATNTQRNHISELIDMLQSEGLDKDLGHDVKPAFGYGSDYM